MVAQVCEYTKNPFIVHLKWVKYPVCEFYLIKPVIYKKVKWDKYTLTLTNIHKMKCILSYPSPCTISCPLNSRPVLHKLNERKNHLQTWFKSRLWFLRGRAWDSAFSNKLRCGKVKRAVSSHHRCCATKMHSAYPKAVRQELWPQVQPPATPRSIPRRAFPSHPSMHSPTEKRQEEMPPLNTWISDSQACLLCQPCCCETFHQAPPPLS